MSTANRTKANRTKATRATAVVSLPVARREVSRALAATLAEARFADLPAAVVAEAGRAVLDWLGSCLAGAPEPPARMARRVAATLGVSKAATIFGGRRGSAAGAAFANGVASHILELDDVHRGSTLHAAAAVIPAALAVAEREHASGERFLLAVVLGYDAAFRVGEAVNPSHYRFFHPTGTAATFGAAAAAGSLLGLTADQMLDALGSAGTQAAGLWEFNADGSMSKHLHPGKAAMNGVLAADLAREGFTGARHIIEGERGFLRAMSTERDAARVLTALGRRWKIVENCYKLHACCGHTHSAVDVALELRAARGWFGAAALDAIREVQVETYGPGYDIVRNDRPGTPYQAKFSLAYCVSVALLEGRVGLGQFAEDRFSAGRLTTRAVEAMIRKVRVRVAEDLTGKYPAAWPTRLTVRFADGTDWHGEADYPRGNPENFVPTAVLEGKLIDLVAPRLGESAARAALGAVDALPSTPDMATAFKRPAAALAARDLVPWR
jgi:2-methylcitrate dehydratase PrpD